MIKKRTFILQLEHDGFYRYHFPGEVMTWLSFCSDKIKTIFGLETPSLRLTISQCAFKGSRRVVFRIIKEHDGSFALYSSDFTERITTICGVAIRDELGGGTYYYTLEAV